MHIFQSYPEWHAAITGRCGLVLTREYCEERIAALRDPSIPSTRAFIEQYGEPYRDEVIAWFEQARGEAAA